jgi:hypothetical protein
MKVGFIVECGPQGAETKVIPHLARLLAPNYEFVAPISLDNKDKLRRGCGKWAKSLLDQGCERVLIIWDLLPDWGEHEGRGCRHDDKEQIAASLQAAGLQPDDRRISLICIEKMLEAWIRSDERALSAFLSTGSHPIKVRRRRNTETIPDPKAELTTLFRKSGSRIRQYVDYVHAIQIVKRAPDLQRFRKCGTFRRFEEKLSS